MSARSAPCKVSPSDQDQTIVPMLSRSIATAFIFLEALDRQTLSRVLPPLTPAQYHALDALGRTPGQTLGALAETLLCDKGNASGIMDRLQAHGLADRLPDDTDRRRVALYLTPRGVQTLADATERRTAALQRALHTIDFDCLDATNAGLIRLISSLEAAVSSAEDRNDTRTISEGGRDERAL
jgi:DNA-binding MarR family transcriptional regulator